MWRNEEVSGMKHIYENPLGYWRVTTEGDCEGRTTKELGTYYGYSDEIAFYLADKCAYSLHFSKLDEQEMKVKDVVPKRNKVVITYDIKSETWDMNPDERANYFRDVLLKDRNVTIQSGGAYAAVTLISGKKTKEDMKNEALAKLTQEERDLLGLK